jgi:hypothetical protein
VREVVAVAIGAILVTAVFVPHVVDGSFYNDGWQYLSNYRFAPKPGFLGAVANFDHSSFRPGQMVYWPVEYALFGDHAQWHLAWSVGWAIAMSLALFALLRQLGIGMDRLLGTSTTKVRP